MRTVEAVWAALPIVVAVAVTGTLVWVIRTDRRRRTAGAALLALAVAGWCGVVLAATGIANWQPGRWWAVRDPYAVRPWSLLPLRPLWRALDGHAVTTGMWEQMGGNLLLLAPLGILVPLLTGTRPRVRRVAMLAACVSAGLEALQLVGRFGIADVDDVLLNTTGVVLAYVGLRLGELSWRRSAPWRRARRRTP